MTNEITRPETTAGELTVGQHVRLGGYSATPYRVDHVYRRSTDVLVLLDPVGGGTSLSRIWPSALRVLLVTAEELAELEVAARRARLVAALRELADDIEDLALPVPDYRADFTIMPGTDYGPWAEYLGTEVRIHPEGFPTVRRRSEVLEVSVIGENPAEADVVPLDVAAGVERVEAAQAEVDAAALVDGITTLLDSAGESTEGAEHAHAGGVIGGPGENEVECACGLVFGGFDSQVSALAILDRHIANPQGTEATSDGAR